MFRAPPFLLAVALGLGLCPPVLCQQDEPAPCQQDDGPVAAEADATSRVERAIADYEALKGKGRPAAQRRRALLWLGEIDDAAVTGYLQRELAAAGDTAAAADVIEAIARVPRPSLQPELWDALRRTGAPVAARDAAANAIVRSGDRGIDRMVEFVREAGDMAPKARLAAIGALVDAGGERAHRGLAPLLLVGTPAEQLAMLRRMESVHGVHPVSAARIRLLKEATFEVAACAWRQLAVEGHERARSLAIDMLERLVEEPQPPVAAELIGGLVRVRDPDLYPLLLRYGSGRADVVRKAVRAAAPFAAKDKALVDWLITRGIETEKPGEREAARLLLAEAPAEAVKPLLEKVRAELRVGRKKSLDVAIALHPILLRDPSWTGDLLNLATSPDADVRLVGLSLLLEMGSDRAVVQAQRDLTHATWELRSMSIRYLTRCRDTSSIPLLIARVDREDGRLAHEVNNALFAHTGTRCISRGEWEQWWEKNRVGFVMPREESVREIVDTGTGPTIAYHGIPLVSSRVAFLVDVSGSMKERVGTDKKYTRLAAAKEQLVKVLGDLPADCRCNLISYETKVHPLWEGLRKVGDDNRKLALDAVAQLGFGGGTNIFDALDTAFRDPDVDTVYLLTDGQPTVGALIDPQDILDEVARMNRRRQIVIHCISVGLDSDLLKRLASGSGGVYRRVS